MGASDTEAGGSETGDRDSLRNALKRNEKLAAELKAARSHLRSQKQETERVQKYLRQAMAEKKKLAAQGAGSELEEAHARIAQLEQELDESESDLTLLEDQLAQDQAARKLDQAQIQALQLRIVELEKSGDPARIATQLEQVFGAEVAMLNARITELEEEATGYRDRLQELAAETRPAITEWDALSEGRTELEAALTTLQSQLAEREESLAGLHRRLAEREETLAELREQSVERASDLAALRSAQAEEARLQARIQELETALSQSRDERVADLETALEQRQKRLARLEAALMKRGTDFPRIEALEARIAELQSEQPDRHRVAELEKELALQAEVQNTLLQDAVKREARIQELEKEREQQNDRRDALEGHTMAVSQLETELRQERARLAKLQGDAQQWLQGERAARDAEIEQLKRILAQKAHQEKESADQVDSLRRQLEALEKQPGAPSGELEQALARLAQLRAESQAALDREVARNDETVAALDRQLRETSDRLKTAEAERQAAQEQVTLREARVAELEHALKVAGLRSQELEQTLSRRLDEQEQANRLSQKRAAELETAVNQRDIRIAGLEDQLRRTQRELNQVDQLAESFEAEMRQQVEDLQRRLSEAHGTQSLLESGASSWPETP